MTCKIITIDGESGVGKGTLSLRLVKALNASYLDSGAIYRAAALYLEQKGIPAELSYDDATLGKVLALVKELPLTFKEVEGVLRIFLDKEDVTEQIRLETTGAKASKIANQGPIRLELIEFQRNFALGKELLIAEGRDMGTAIFPDAFYQVFLMASPRVKAERRYLELKNKGLEVNFEEILESLETRDRQDKTRKVNPLVPSQSAQVIDTSNLDRDEVFELVYQEALKRLEALK